MTFLKPLIDALDEVLAENAVTTTAPSVAEMITSTGLHPNADYRQGQGRHALPWTPGSVLSDAKDALTQLTPEGRHRDRGYFLGPLPMLRRTVAAAEWTVGALG